MSSSFKWYHAAIIAGGALGVGGLLCYLMREESAEATRKLEAKEEEEEKIDVNKATKEQVLSILNQVITSQEKMKAVMKDLIKELKQGEHQFEEVYQKVKHVQPADPLETTGLTMAEFDQLLDRYQNDPNVRDAIGKIMGAPGPLSFSSKVSSIRREKIVEIHAEMLKELKELVDQFQQLKNRHEYDTKTVTIATQAVVGASIEKKFDLASDEIEAAVLLHHQSLATDEEFGRINVQMQSTMSELIGSPFPASLF